MNAVMLRVFLIVMALFGFHQRRACSWARESADLWA
jgi:hypothetical protein